MDPKGPTFLGTVWEIVKFSNIPMQLVSLVARVIADDAGWAKGDSLKSEAIGMIAGALYGYFASYFPGWIEADTAGKEAGEEAGQEAVDKEAVDASRKKVSQEEIDSYLKSGSANTEGSKDWDAEGAYSKASDQAEASQKTSDEIYRKAYDEAYKKAFDKTYLGFYVKSSKRSG